MSFFLRRDSDPAAANGPRAISKPSRRVTKEDISRPTLIPWGTSQSLPDTTSTIHGAMRGHKRGKSEPLPVSHEGFSQPLGAVHRGRVTRIILSALPSTLNIPLLSPFPRRTVRSGTVQLMIPINTNKPLPDAPKSQCHSPAGSDIPCVTVTQASPIAWGDAIGADERSYRVEMCDSIDDLMEHVRNNSLCPAGDYGSEVVHDHKQADNTQQSYAEILRDALPFKHTESCYLEPALDDASCVRPLSTYSALHAAGHNVDDIPIPKPIGRKRARSSVSSQDTLVDRLSQYLTESGIPHRIERGEAPARPIPDAPMDSVISALRYDSDLITEALDISEQRFARGSIAPSADQPFRRHIRQRSVEEHFELQMRRKGAFLQDSPAYQGASFFGGDYVDDPVDEIEI